VLQLVRLSGAVRSSFPPPRASGEVEPFLLPMDVALIDLQIHSLQFLTFAVCFFLAHKSRDLWPNPACTANPQG